MLLLPFVAVILLAKTVPASGELVDFDLVLDPTSQTIHYTDFYLRGPGYLDLSSLFFTAVDQPSDTKTVVAWQQDDDGGTDDDDQDGGGGTMRHLAANASYIDIVAFRLPPKCANSRGGCDWTDLGVGAKHSDGSVRWCCSADAVSGGYCQGGVQRDRLILGEGFQGTRRSVPLPLTGNVTAIVDRGVFPVSESGKYVTILANCNNAGRHVQVTGTAAWKSVHGYLPGELYGFLYFYAILTVVYFALVLWYGISMHLNEESRIPIEKWILLTIILGLLEMLFRLGDVFVWNEDGYQSNWIAFVGIFVGVIKRGASRCLIVMVSLGWGVTRDSLGRKLKWILIAGTAYIVSASVRDVMIVLAVEDVQSISERIEQDLIDVYSLLTFVVAAIDVVFVMWILDAVGGTMDYLDKLNQTRKLKRYLALRCIFLFSVLFAAIWVLFAVANAYTEGIVEEEDAWIIEGASEVNYLFILIGVAILWRPNPSAKEYAYAMELSSTINENGGTELELIEVVPSAVDDYDEDDYDGITPPGYSVSKHNGFKEVVRPVT